jgi:hypothetical protein
MHKNQGKQSFIPLPHNAVPEYSHRKLCIVTKLFEWAILIKGILWIYVDGHTDDVVVCILYRTGNVSIFVSF